MLYRLYDILSKMIHLVKERVSQPADIFSKVLSNTKKRHVRENVGTAMVAEIPTLPSWLDLVLINKFFHWMDGESRWWALL